MVDVISGVFVVLHIYVIVIVLFLILDNRDPVSTLSWLLIFLLFPLFGLCVYIMFGRNWRKETRKKLLKNQFIGKSIINCIRNIVSYQEREINKLEKVKGFIAKKNLFELLKRNSHSMLVHADDIRVYTNGEEKFKSLLADLKKAKKFIHLEYYIIRKDPLTRSIQNILIQKAREGVEVRLLYDAMGCLFLDRGFVKRLKRAGVFAYPYFNFLSPFRFHTANYRNHRKIVVIDGEIAYTGGMNLGEEYVSGGRSFPSWNDKHVRVKGTVVQVLQSVFAVSWYNTTGKKLFYERYFPVQKKGGVPMQVTTSGPDSKWESIQQLFFALINSAEKSVYIQTPYFIPEKSILEALKAAALSGLDVRIMVTGHVDKRLPYWAAFTYFDELLEAGVKIYHYKKGFMHAKMIVVDSDVCSLGTANMDVRSFKLDYELNLMIYDKKISQNVRNLFIEDINGCREFTKEKLRSISVGANFRNSVARLFAPLL